MLQTLLPLVVLAAHLPVLLLIHVALWRLVPPPPRTPPQGRALLAVILAASLSCLETAALAWSQQHFWAILTYGFLFCNCLGVVYFLMFCNTESGRRYHLVRLLLARKQLDVQEVHQLYSKRHMVEKRLDRLLEWGALRWGGERFFLGKRWFWIVSLLFYGWSRLLGYVWFPGPKPTAERSDDPSASEPRELVTSRG